MARVWGIGEGQLYLKNKNKYEKKYIPKKGNLKSTEILILIVGRLYFILSYSAECSNFLKLLLGYFCSQKKVLIEHK